MDIRVIKSKKAINDAFLLLRAKKELKKITVKELCKKAMVNKSTFYSHYNDIFDLEDKIENEVIHSIVNSISHPEYIIENSSEFTKEIIYAFNSNAKLINTLFSDDCITNLAEKTIKELRETIYKRSPTLRENKKASIALDYALYGSYYAFKENTDLYGKIDAESAEPIFELASVIGDRIRKYIQDNCS